MQPAGRVATAAKGAAQLFFSTARDGSARSSMTEAPPPAPPDCLLRTQLSFRPDASVTRSEPLAERSKGRPPASHPLPSPGGTGSHALAQGPVARRPPPGACTGAAASASSRGLNKPLMMVQFRRHP